MRLSPGVAIERMTERDVAAVAAIDRASFRSSAAASGDESVARIREELARPWSRIWIARRDAERVVAFVLVWKVIDEMHVLNLATELVERRKGLGYALMQTVIEDAEVEGVRLILLEVRASNRAARALYVRHGFVESGVRARYYDDGEDAVEMQKSLLQATEEATRR